MDTELSSEVVKQRQKLSQCLLDSEALSIQQLSKAQDLTAHRDWFLTLLKQAKKLQEAVNDDFIERVNESEQLQRQLGDSMQQIGDLEKANRELQAQLRNGEDTNADDNDNSFTMATGSSSRALLENMQSENNKLQHLVYEEEKKYQAERERYEEL